MASVGSEEMQIYDLDTKHGIKALRIFLGAVTGKGEIDEKYLPLNLRGPEKAEEKKRFQALLRENLALVELASKHGEEQAAAQRGRGRRGRRARADEAEEAAAGDDGSAKGPKGVAVTRFFNRLLALKVDAQHDVFGMFENIFDQVLMEGTSTEEEEEKGEGLVDLQRRIVSFLPWFLTPPSPPPTTHTHTHHHSQGHRGVRRRHR